MVSCLGFVSLSSMVGITIVSGGPTVSPAVTFNATLVDVHLPLPCFCAYVLTLMVDAGERGPF